MTNSISSSRCREQGFTLVELLIVVTIVGLLATIAIPGYAEYVRRAHRTAAKSLLTDLTSRQESFRADRKGYATTLALLGVPSPLYLEADGDLTTSSAAAVYVITIEGATATEFTFAATPQNGQTTDTKCAVLRLSSTGARSASGTNGISCWER